MQNFNRIDLHANGLTFPAIEMGSGPLVLLLHGFPDTNRSFRFQLPALAAAGYRAIAPTMRGYDPKCIPSDGAYDYGDMAEDVVGWLDDLNVESAHVIGHDHGSLIAQGACVLAPERFQSLVMIAVPHPEGTGSAVLKMPSQLLNSWYIIFFQLRPLAKYVVERDNWALIEKLWRDWSPDWALPMEEIANVKAALSQPGVKEAAMAYYWSNSNKLGRDGKKTTDPVEVPTMGLTGALDGCIDTRLFDETMTERSFPSGVEIIRIEGAGHFVHQEKPEQINQLFVDWLDRNA